ncbi:MAG TPA: DNA-formamidopyrimidine glycosylase family protein [Capsulimonadaceae bacterium]|jgi:formamidopyrimidine-DNA glycosylase
MPELPDITVYIEAMRDRMIGQPLVHARIASPFLLRTAVPPIASVNGKTVRDIYRVGKRIAIELDDELTLVMHLMIAGRLHWRPPSTRLVGKNSLAAFDFENGVLVLTEAGTKRRASLHVLADCASVRAMDSGGIDIAASSRDEFAKTVQSENHTLKRALTDPRLFSGIGNSYSDEILFAAQMAPTTLTQRLSDDEIDKLRDAVIATMDEWTERLRAETNGKFPENVTAFRKEMAVHGRYNLPCPRCGAPVQRIRYADNETNYCAPCQTGGKLLSDRALARLLGSDWPKTLDGLELLAKKHRAE